MLRGVELLLQLEDLLVCRYDLLVLGLVLLYQVVVLLAGVVVGLVVALEGCLQGGHAACELLNDFFVLLNGPGQALCDASVVLRSRWGRPYTGRSCRVLIGRRVGWRRAHIGCPGAY